MFHIHPNSDIQQHTSSRTVYMHLHFTKLTYNPHTSCRGGFLYSTVRWLGCCRLFSCLRCCWWFCRITWSDSTLTSRCTSFTWFGTGRSGLAFITIHLNISNICHKRVRKLMSKPCKPADEKYIYIELGDGHSLLFTGTHTYLRRCCCVGGGIVSTLRPVSRYGRGWVGKVLWYTPLLQRVKLRHCWGVGWCTYNNTKVQVTFYEIGVTRSMYFIRHRWRLYDIHTWHDYRHDYSRRLWHTYNKHHKLVHRNTNVNNDKREHHMGGNFSYSNSRPDIPIDDSSYCNSVLSVIKNLAITVGQQLLWLLRGQGYLKVNWYVSQYNRYLLHPFTQTQQRKSALSQLQQHNKIVHFICKREELCWLTTCRVSGGGGGCCGLQSGGSEFWSKWVQFTTTH